MGCCGSSGRAPATAKSRVHASKSHSRDAVIVMSPAGSHVLSTNATQPQSQSDEVKNRSPRVQCDGDDVIDVTATSTALLAAVDQYKGACFHVICCDRGRSCCETPLELGAGGSCCLHRLQAVEV